LIPLISASDWHRSEEPVEDGRQIREDGGVVIDGDGQVVKE